MTPITPVLAFGPLGTTEMVIIFLLILILFGAKKLPTFARSLGKSMGEFRKAKDEFERELNVGEDEVRTTPRLREPVGRQPVEPPAAAESAAETAADSPPKDKQPADHSAAP